MRFFECGTDIINLDQVTHCEARPATEGQPERLVVYLAAVESGKLAAVKLGEYGQRGYDPLDQARVVLTGRAIPKFLGSLKQPDPVDPPKPSEPSKPSK